ncbi:MAG: group I intron-associated PD-(D/E)XK endonuclease [Burkholderiales bacterium]
MNTNRIGNISLLEVSSLFLRLGYNVFMPMGDGYRIDLVVGDVHGKLFRIQIKTVAAESPKGVVRIRTCGRNAKHYVGDVDHVIAYDRRDGCIYAVKPERAGTVTLAKTKPKTNKRYVLAADCLLHRVYEAQWGIRQG